jgi:hypothetical protein
MWHCLTYILGRLKSGTACEAKLSSLLILVTWSFKTFHKEGIDDLILLKWYSQIAKCV